MSGFKNIVLIGPMGAGKTTIGKRLSVLLHREFIDTDELLEQQFNTSVSNIFQNHGETFFREYESKLLTKIKLSPAKVIATGGGCILDPTNRLVLQGLGTVYYLQVSVDSQLQRLAMINNRPLLPSINKQRQLYLLKTMSERVPFYEAIADLKVNTDNKSIDAVIAQLKSLIYEPTCQ